MDVKVDVICYKPYKLTLNMTETELSAIQDMLQAVSIRNEQFSQYQCELAKEISNMITKAWDE